jgi:hypothetical protein
MLWRPHYLECVFQAKACRSHSVDNSLVCCLHLTFYPVFHGLVENVVGIEVNCHHYVPVSLLGREGKATGLIGVYGFAQFLDVEKDVWWQMKVVGGESSCSCLIVTIAISMSLLMPSVWWIVSPVAAP